MVLPNRWLRAAVFLVGMFAFIQVYSIQAILPLLMRDLQISEVQAGMAVGATVCGIALMSPFMGMLSDAFGRKRFIVGSLAFLGLPTLLAGFSDSISSMIAFRFLQGLAVPGITVVLIAYIGEEFMPAMVTRLMTLYVAGTVMGGFSGRFLMGHLSAWANWQMAFLMMGVLSIVSALFVAKQLPASQNFVANSNFQTAFYTLQSHLHRREVLAPSALGACVLFSLVGCFTYINLHLSHAPYELSSSDLANIFAVYLIGMVMTPLSARLMTKWGSVKTVLLAIVWSMLGVMATGLSSLVGIIIALVLMSSGVFITQAATINYLANKVNTGRSLASGLYYMSYYGGGALGAWLCGLAYSAYGWHGVMLTLFAVQILALMIAKWGMRR